MKKIVVATGLFATLLLAGCQPKEQTATSDSTSNTSTTTTSSTATSASATQATIKGSTHLDAKTTSETSAESTTDSTATTATTGSSETETTTSTKESTTTSMDFTKIKAGDFSDLAGEWHEIYTGYNAHDGQGYQQTRGGEDTLTVTTNTIDNGQMTFTKGTLEDNNGSHEISFFEENNTLQANLSDPNSAINWGLTFYPVGTTSEYPINGEASNEKNLLVIWTSNNSYTQVFAQGPATDIAKTRLDLAQLQNQDFTSLVGVWRNDTGKEINVTNEIVTKPEGSEFSFASGAVIRGEVGQNGLPQVIALGEMTGDYLQGGLGSFDTTAPFAAFGPLAIVPQGVQMSDLDDSDSTRDRLIVGAGQSGYAEEAYYRQ